ncbi:MAG: TIGR03089 family protein [Nocardioides sp.]
MHPAPSRTFPDLLTAQLRVDASRPLVTFYDDATGERIELSVTTYANWVAKTAGLLQDELDAERGGLVLVDLPVHWQGAVWLGAAWSLGMRVTDDPSAAGDADVVVCGPDGVARYAPYAGGAAVVALSLRPLGARFAEPLPDGVVDYGAVVLGQPDAFLAYDPPAADVVAWADGSTQAGLLAEAGERALVGPGGRLATDVAATTRAGLVTLLGPLAAGGGTVWVRHPDASRWDDRVASERATATLRA